MKQGSRQSRQIFLFLLLASLTYANTAYATENSPEWRQSYRSMVGAYYTNDYDGAINEAKVCLDKIVLIRDQTEKNVALDELIKYLNMLGTRNRQQQNYSQQELLLKCKLKANEAKGNSENPNEYQTAQIKKELVTCLVLEGKPKEAEAYLAKPEKLQKPSSTSGWKNDLDLLAQANGYPRVGSPLDAEQLCTYATNAANSALSIKNATEQEVAFEQIIQQLRTTQYRYKNTKDYLHEEKILKLLLKMQEPQKAEDAPGIVTAYTRAITLKELVTCLIMQDKDDEATEYNKAYHEIINKLTQDRKNALQNFIQRSSPTIENGISKPADI